MMMVTSLRWKEKKCILISRESIINSKGFPFHECIKIKEKKRKERRKGIAWQPANSNSGHSYKSSICDDGSFSQ